MSRSPYERGDFLVTPRKIETWVGVDEGEPQIPPQSNVRARGGHWVGWIRFGYDEPVDYAVWQDYKKRGFFVWKHGMDHAEGFHAQTIEQLIASLEAFHTSMRIFTP